MLLSIISSSAVSSSAISMTTDLGLPQYGAVVVVGLIVLLFLREVLSASRYWTRSLNTSFNLAIVPLLLCFGLIVVAEITTVLA
jgi:hypothetical protein